MTSNLFVRSEADRVLRLCWRVNQLFHNGVHSSELLAVFLLLALKLFHFEGKIFVGSKYFPKFYESPDDKDVHLYGPLAVEHRREHGYAVLGKDVREFPAAAPS